MEGERDKSILSPNEFPSAPGLPGVVAFRLHAACQGPSKDAPNVVNHMPIALGGELRSGGIQ